MFKYGHIIITSIILGLASRISLLRIDYRQYPSYPQGFFSHLALGLIASSLGSLAIPAIFEMEYSAVTFLALAAQQFRDVRNLERQSLDNIEPTEMVSRGTAYIEDIAKAFEARNYVAMLTSLLVSTIITIVNQVFDNRVSVVIGAVLGTIIVIYLNKVIARQKIYEIADVKPAKISFEGPLLKVNDVIIMNVGLKASQKIYMEKGIAVEIIPKNENSIAILSSAGQRQAIQHNEIGRAHV